MLLACMCLVPRLIRLQLNARSTPRPGIDCIWAWLEFDQTSEFLQLPVTPLYYYGYFSSGFRWTRGSLVLPSLQSIKMVATGAIPQARWAWPASKKGDGLQRPIQHSFCCRKTCSTNQIAVRKQSAFRNAYNYAPNRRPFFSKMFLAPPYQESWIRPCLVIKLRSWKERLLRWAWPQRDLDTL